jgi:hypothetical protein
MVCKTEPLWIETAHNYQQDRWVSQTRYVYGIGNKTARCQADLFVKLIMCDYYVHELVQQEETLKEKGWALRKMRNADEDRARLQKTGRRARGAPEEILTSGVGVLQLAMQHSQWPV